MLRDLSICSLLRERWDRSGSLDGWNKIIVFAKDIIFRDQLRGDNIGNENMDAIEAENFQKPGNLNILAVYYVINIVCSGIVIRFLAR